MKTLIISTTMVVSAAFASAQDFKSSFLTAAGPHDAKAGHTITLAPGKPAKVTSRVIKGVTFFDFSIPRGSTGIQGVVGPVGPVGPAGPAGPNGQPADKHRSIYVAGGSLSYAAGATGVTQVTHGVAITNTATASPAFVVPRPADWDPATAFSVTLYFAVNTNSVSDTTAKWRLKTESININLTGGGGGWDSLDFEVTEDAAAMLVSKTNYSNVMKSQTWTAKWSSAYNTWYFGTSVNTNNQFSADELWRFGFARGFANSNGESATNTFTITGATVDYLSK